MKKWIVYFQLVALSLFIVGCSSTSQKPSVSQPANKDVAWQKRQASFNKTREWRLQAKVAITHRGDNWPFRLSWLQRQGDNYEMNIKHPLTDSVLAYIKSDASGVLLRDQKGKTYRDRDAEALLKRQMKVTLPLKGMKYWARGIASPNYAKAKVSLDKYGRPLTMIQAGWKIDYPLYGSGGSYALPEKIILNHTTDGTRIKVIAKEWKVRN